MRTCCLAQGAELLFKPGPGLQQDVRDMFETPLETCACGCKLTRRMGEPCAATLHDITGTKQVAIQSWRCVGRHCRATHGPNFMWLGSEKRNAVSLADPEKVGALFIRNKRGFTLRYLRLFENLACRCVVSLRGTDWALRETFGEATDSTYDAAFHSRQRRNHLNVLTCLLSVQELEAVGKHMEVMIEGGISETHLCLYDKRLHENVFGPPAVVPVTALAGDGA